MFEHQTPFEIVAKLSGSTDLDVDTNQANRYCIRLNSASGKESYYFGTPIYNVISRKLIRRKFSMMEGCYRFVGSNCEVWITASYIKLVREKNELVIHFEKDILWSFKDGRLLSDHFFITPTYNGICVEGRVDQMNFDTTINFAYQNIRTSQNCVCFMESRFKPIAVISALYTKSQTRGFQPMQVKYRKIKENTGSLRFVFDTPGVYGAFEINFYEPKLIQDTPVSKNYSKENNAFGPIAFLGKSLFYGTQWLYFRLDLEKMPELPYQYIREVKLFIPCYISNSLDVDVFGLSNRFCSFGSNWNNKVQKENLKSTVIFKGEYACVELTKFYTNRGRLIESAGVVFVPARANELGCQVISTGDSYTLPPILCVKHRNL